MTEQALITRLNGLLEGYEPEAWPVPIHKADLRAVLGMAECLMALNKPENLTSHADYMEWMRQSGRLL